MKKKSLCFLQHWCRQLQIDLIRQRKLFFSTNISCVLKYFKKSNTWPTKRDRNRLIVLFWHGMCVYTLHFIESTTQQGDRAIWMCKYIDLTTEFGQRIENSNFRLYFWAIWNKKYFPFTTTYTASLWQNIRKNINSFFWKKFFIFLV